MYRQNIFLTKPPPLASDDMVVRDKSRTSLIVGSEYGTVISVSLPPDLDVDGPKRQKLGHFTHMGRRLAWIGNGAEVTAGP